MHWPSWGLTVGSCCSGLREVGLEELRLEEMETEELLGALGASELSLITFTLLLLRTFGGV